MRAQIKSGDVDGMYLEYETFGDKKYPCVLLIMGLAVQVRLGVSFSSCLRFVGNPIGLGLGYKY